jgi:hypothetical protein
MANEINIQAVLAFQRTTQTGTVAVQGAGTKTFDQTPGSRGISTVKKPTFAAPTELVTEITIPEQSLTISS